MSQINNIDLNNFDEDLENLIADIKVSFIETKEETKPEIQSFKKDNNYAYTKFCQNESECKVENCTYAHTLDQFKPTKCNYGEGCRLKFKNCKFIHPTESNLDYCKRNNIKYPGEEKKEEVIIHKPLYKPSPKTSPKQDNNDKAPRFFDNKFDITIFSNKKNLPRLIDRVIRMGYTNFGVNILKDYENDTKILINDKRDIISYLNNTLSKLDFESTFKLDGDDLDRFKFIFSENGLKIRNGLSEGRTKSLNGEVNILQIIDVIQDLLYYKSRVNKITLNNDNNLTFDLIKIE